MLRFLSFCWFLFLTASVFAQLARVEPVTAPLAAGSTTSLQRLQLAVETLDRHPGMVSASWSISVMDAETGKPILLHNADRSLATASTMKALTTATALEVLGADFRFETVLEYDGEIDANGILRGNLYIRGDGDPTLGSDRFGSSEDLPGLMAQWTKEIQAKGIRQINGKIIGDETVFSTQITPAKWPWEDLGNYYGAGPAGLNLHENYYRLDLKPGATAGSATEVIGTEPDMTEITFLNELLTGPVGSGDQAYIYGAPYTRLHYLRGTIPAGKSVFSIKGSIPDPAFFCARQLMEALYNSGVPAMEGFSSMRMEKMNGAALPTARKPIYVHRSRPLSEIIRPLNQFSINLYAEALLNRIAVKKGLPGSTEQGVAVVEAHWKARGIDTRGMFLRDGSGLSPNNVLSTYQMSSVLVKVRQSQNYAVFNASLPVAGQTGTLRSMCKGTAAEGNLRAKSGYISGVRAYTGFVENRSGKTLAFAMIGNHFTFSASEMRRQFEVLMANMALLE